MLDVGERPETKLSRCGMLEFRTCGVPTSFLPARTSTTIQGTAIPPTWLRYAKSATCCMTPPSTVGSAGGMSSGFAPFATSLRILAAVGGAGWGELHISERAKSRGTH